MNAHWRIDPLLMAGGIAAAPFAGWWALPAWALATVAVHGTAVAHPRCSWHCHSHWRLGADCPGVALTFDDGPHPDSTPRLLDLLAEHGMAATFFVIGRHAEAHPQLCRRMMAEGHSIGCHSLTHDRAFALRTGHRQGADIDAARDCIAQATGAEPPRLFRPPVGLRNPSLGDVLRRRDMRCVTWSASARDGSGGDPLRAARRLLRGLRPGAILTAHDGHEPGRARDTAGIISLMGQVLPAVAALGGSVALVASPQGLGWRPCCESSAH